VLKRSVASATLLVALLAAGACEKQSAPGPDVWATVNGKEIKRDEVEKYLRARSNPDGQQPSHEENLSLTLSILDELINQEILLERAKKLGIEASDGEVEDKFTERKSPFTEEEFQRQLKENGVTVDDLKKEIRRQLSIQKLINREVVAKISITDQDIADFYKQNESQFNVPETRFRVARILVTPRRDPNVRNRANDDAGNDSDAKRKAGALLERINQGADFASVATDYSEDPVTSASGGDMGFIPESSLNQVNPAVRKVIQELKVGQVSQVVQTGEGYWILKLLAREAPGQRRLDDPRVQQPIRDNLRSRKEQLLRASYMTTARDEAKIANYLARQVIESAGKLPEINTKKPATAPTAPAKK